MYENQTLAIVGESGCGKSVTAMSILGLVSEPGEIMPGSKILYTGNGKMSISPRLQMQKFRIFEEMKFQ